MNRIEREKKTIRKMVELYCRHKERNPKLCASCIQLLTYTHRRLDTCKFGNSKCSCEKCTVHCYAPAYRAKIREVMRYAGPRMLFYHPFAAIRHLTGG